MNFLLNIHSLYIFRRIFLYIFSVQPIFLFLPFSFQLEREEEGLKTVQVEGKTNDHFRLFTSKLRHGNEMPCNFNMHVCVLSV